MSAADHPRARNVRFGVLIVSDAATLILSDGQHHPGPAGMSHPRLMLAAGCATLGKPGT